VLFSSRVRIRIRCSVWLVSCYVHAYLHYFRLSLSHYRSVAICVGWSVVDVFQKNLLTRVVVHIADSNVIKTTESPDYDIIRLISDIGGQLGLWIGVSVITLVEVLQLAALIVRVLTARRRRRLRPSAKTCTARSHTHTHTHTHTH